jgi:hypothetical protein
MVVRDVAATIGALLVLTAAASVIGTVVVPRAVRSRLVIGVNWIVDLLFLGLAHIIPDTRRRDSIMAAWPATLLISQLVVWLAVFLLGFGLLLLPFTAMGFGHVIAEAGSDMTTIGFVAARGTASEVIAVIAAFAAVGTIALQIGYLPALYSAYNRRETEVALLAARAGVPSWGPELLARTHYGLGTGSTLGTFPEFYEEWERWAADVTESHATYVPLVYFRSPRPFGSWVTALLAVLDSAALYLALCPSTAPVIPARLCLRAGFVCFTRVALAMGFDIPEEADPSAGISITYDEFLEAVARLRRVDFEIEREPKDAWPHFVGWRINYERAAYAIAGAVFAPPALWSGPRRVAVAPVAPLRPPDRPPSRSP